MKRLIPAVIGALFFAAFGPLIGAVIVILAGVLGGGNLWADSGWQHFTSTAGLVFLLAYIIGIVPAFLTGLIACGLFPRIKSLARFLGVCVLADVAASGSIGYTAYRFFGNLDPNPGIHGGTSAWIASLVLTVLGLIPALVIGGIWYRRQPREQAATPQPAA